MEKVYTFKLKHNLHSELNEYINERLERWDGYSVVNIKIKHCNITQRYFASFIFGMDRRSLGFLYK